MILFPHLFQLKKKNRTSYKKSNDINVNIIVFVVVIVVVKIMRGDRSATRVILFPHLFRKIMRGYRHVVKKKRCFFNVIF